jgi:hypothetical protein
LSCMTIAPPLASSRSSTRRPCTSAYVSMHTSACIRQHTSAYVSIRQHTLASSRSSTRRPCPSAYVSIRTSACGRKRQHTLAYVGEL